MGSSRRSRIKVIIVMEAGKVNSIISNSSISNSRSTTTSGWININTMMSGKLGGDVQLLVNNQILLLLFV